MKSFITVLCVIFTGLMAGCSSPMETRIAEKSAAFQALTPDEQAAIRYGEISEGNTTEMVYMALGKASEVTAQEEAGHHVELWTYRNYVPGTNRPKDRKGGNAMAPMSKGSSVFQSLPSDASIHGDMPNAPRGPSGSADPPVESNTRTLLILFRDGKVAGIQLES